MIDPDFYTEGGPSPSAQTPVTATVDAATEPTPAAPATPTPRVSWPGRRGISPAIGRRILRFVIIAGILAAGGRFSGLGGTTSAESAAGARQDLSAVEAAQQRLAPVLSAAASHQGSTGSFAGFDPGPGVAVAAGRHTIVVSAQVDSAEGVTCAFGGIVDGGPPDVRVDPSGSACDPQLIAEASAAIAQAESGGAQGG